MVLIPLFLLGIGVTLWSRRMQLMPTLWAACVCVLFASPAWAQERTKETFPNVADRMVQAINATDYTGIRQDFNKEMQQALPVEQCKTFFSKEISGKFGKINKLEPPQFKSAATAVFVARCERGTLDFTLTLDNQGRVAGMLFRPRSDSPPDEKQTDAAVIDSILKKINAKQDDALFGQLTTEFQKALPKNNFHAAMQQIRKQFGKLNQSTEQKPAGQAKVYRVQAEKGACIVKITLDKQGKIAGLQITPESSPPQK